ncbi:uncharacterized protein MONBRDRAFT_25573 [Monosiga brevicollis MX1]|uniref:PDZ domain-containing protein n=1 Tax=Monosiga brevicollis TaxID=81824 RepID=A9UZT6_MONBE|nr:uncharacterized protein MONBRDRAFT_25573 [Monosiga brevicollis MX1]EDQ89290.1 predicted protein [Monosiga brevicollis MX1]|eukprot:XP_001745866.1 hypothetical protein [Monosiga brevicollis MX1]
MADDNEHERHPLLVGGHGDGDGDGDEEEEEEEMEEDQEALLLPRQSDALMEEVGVSPVRTEYSSRRVSRSSAAGSLAMAPPPAYDEPAWCNSRPIGADAEEIDAVLQETHFSEAAPPSFAEATRSQPRGMVSIDMTAMNAREPLVHGPRNILLTRQGDSFGFTLGGHAPTYIVDVEPLGPAARVGVTKGDQILEVNGTDVHGADIPTVSMLIQQTDEQLAMIVAHPPPALHHLPIEEEDGEAAAWYSALRVVPNDARGVDPLARPNSFMGQALCSMFLCPCLGALAVWHSHLVQAAWVRQAHHAAHAHAIMARRTASSAVFYGLMMWMLFLFIYFDSRARADAGNGDDDDWWQNNSTNPSGWP